MGTVENMEKGRETFPHFPQQQQQGQRAIRQQIFFSGICHPSLTFVQQALKYFPRFSLHFSSSVI
jgi:hypothetical protein